MRLPAIISGRTVEKLEKARAERDRVTATIAELTSKLAGLDVGSDDYGPASLTLDGQIRVHERAVEVADRQIAGLEAVLHEEELRAAMARRAADVKTVEAMLPERLEIIKQGVTVAKAVVGFSEKLAAWRKRFLKQYPADLEHPYQHHLDDNWVLRNMFAALQLWPEEANEILDELAPAAAQMHADAIADLRANPPAKSEEEGIAA